MSLRDLVLIRLGVAVNLVIGQIVAALLLPVYLDSVGTMLVAALAGPRAAVLAGLTSQILAAVLSGNFTWLPFGVIQILIALYAAAAVRVGVFRNFGTALAGGLLLGALAGMVAAPIAFYVFGGVTVGGVSFVTTILHTLGLPLKVSTFISSISLDLLDKTLSFGLLYVVLRNLPRHLTARFPAFA